MAVPSPLRLRVWIDAQLPPALARWLAAMPEVDAIHVSELDLLQAPDPSIFRAARAAGTIIVATKDQDFVRLLEEHGPPPQVLWITCGNVRNRELCDLIGRGWPRVAELLRAGEPLVEIAGPRHRDS